MGIVFKHSGSFNKTEKFLQFATDIDNLQGSLDSYAQRGVSALAAATPKDSGGTANAWSYRIIRKKGSIKIEWLNSNLDSQGTPIAVLIQYGHATRNGSWVQGRDFINPAMRSVFDDIADGIWQEVQNA